jgi:hypothetical protein
MKGISINGKKLHEIMMPLVQYEKCSSLVSMRYPKSCIFFEQKAEGELKLKIPSNLALEMYRVGILPQDKNHYFPVSISGKSVGNYKVIDFLYPNRGMHDDIVFILLQKQ